ncbi:TetR/AcrR family transcriptional regulator [Fodinicola feengrottensis]|uniref:TetR/AcrR family transcriptional regulator n=1 Tax=Fodinicola feengrottensis TaxID=435914 RepID=A0ABN2GNL4_9ACTN|nr:TetR/AcrR family transcriptional regulator [Fodinicola feengrottensis]
MDTRRPMRADARRNYDHLLVQAGEAFQAHGVDASLEDIARAAGVGIGTLYRHFPNRDALLLALTEERFDRSRASAEALLDAADPVAALTSWLRRFIANSATYRGLPESVTSVLTNPDSSLYATCHAMQDAGGRLLARAQQAGAVRPDVSARDVFLMAAAIGWANSQVPDDPERIERLLSLLIDGLSRPYAGPGLPERAHIVS